MRWGSLPISSVYFLTCLVHTSSELLSVPDFRIEGGEAPCKIIAVLKKQENKEDIEKMITFLF